MTERTRIFIIDDSALVRQFMAEIIQTQPDLLLVGMAADPVMALPKMQNDWPDVILLDIEMPRMDGLTFLRQIMSTRPTPVVICSSLTEKGASLTLEALSAGAVAVFAKAKLGVRQHLEQIAAALLHALREAARAKNLAMVRRGTSAPAMRIEPVLTAARPFRLDQTTDRLVALGTSTGGTQALELVLGSLPANAPGIVVVQHMPEKFTAAFADLLNQISAIEVREARNGDRIVDGLALIAPGGLHLQVHRNGAHYSVEVIDAPPVNRHKPSVDVLFRSVAQAAGRNALGVIMTGMGDDGARGLLAMREAGASTLAQNAESCVVFGMPKEAIRMGAAQHIASLQDIPRAIMAFAAAGG